MQEQLEHYEQLINRERIMLQEFKSEFDRKTSNLQEAINNCNEKITALTENKPALEPSRVLVFFVAFIFGSFLLTLIGVVMQNFLPTWINQEIERVTSVLTLCNILVASLFFIPYSLKVGIKTFVFTVISYSFIFVDYGGYVFVNYGGQHPEVAATLFNIATIAQQWPPVLILISVFAKMRAQLCKNQTP